MAPRLRFMPWKRNTPGGMDRAPCVTWKNRRLGAADDLAGRAHLLRKVKKRGRDSARPPSPGRETPRPHIKSTQPTSAAAGSRGFLRGRGLLRRGRLGGRFCRRLGGRLRCGRFGRDRFCRGGLWRGLGRRAAAAAVSFARLGGLDAQPEGVLHEGGKRTVLLLGETLCVPQHGGVKGHRGVGFALGGHAGS